MTNAKKQEKRLELAKQQQKANRRALKASSKKPKKRRDFLTPLLEKIFGGKPPKTAQQSIPYRHMYRGGICQVTEKYFTKTVTFSDINYQLAQNEDKTHIFEGYCGFLNYFDSSISVQLSFVNQYGNTTDFEKSINIPMKKDKYSSIRREFTDFLKNQLAKGNNGLVKRKYITFGIEAASIGEAKPKLEHIEADIIGNFKTLGVKAYPLNGLERLETFHNGFHPDGTEKFQFKWKDVAKTGLSTKDFIAPSSFDFRDSKTFRMGADIGAVSFVQIIAPELNDRMLADFLNMDSAVTVNMHIQSIDQSEAIKTIKRKITDLDAMKITEQQKAARSGYDIDVIPTDIATFGDEAKNILKDLQSRNERMFLVTLMVLNTAKTKRKLENDIFAAAGIAQKHNCVLKRLDFQQEQGLMSSLPIGINQIEIQRGLTTSSTAIFVPFTTQELFQRSKEALYYGLNALSNNLIMACRKLLKNPNGLFLGQPGSGKSFAAKREMVNVFLVTDDDIIVCDPEGEYFPLVQRLGGQVVKLSPTSKHYINPMDINADYKDEDPLAIKSDFILSLCELIFGGRDGLSPTQKTIIDRCVRLVYLDYLNDPKPENMPILQDLYELLRKQPELEAQNVATALEIYVTGSLNVFNHHTNVNLNNRFVCYDLKGLGNSQLKKIGMLILQENVWNRVAMNRAGHKSTWFYIDEFHKLLEDRQTSLYSVDCWKRLRKWNGIPTGITQNVNDLLQSREIGNIFENSDFICLFSQGPGDRQILAQKLGISPHQLSYVTNSDSGEGLIIFGATIIPFVDRFPKDTELYGVMTTKPSEVKTSDS